MNNNIRRTIVLPTVTEQESQVNTTSDTHSAYDASRAPIRFPRCVRARSSRRSKGWRNTGRNSAA